jgi:two-component system NtrC family sensor kinase
MPSENLTDPQAFSQGSVHSDVSSGNAVEEEGRVLAGKPSLSIRTRITLGFFICFLMALGITLASLYVVFRLEEKLYFLKVADNFSFEIQQARRFEKNYFLYGTNLPDAVHHVNVALTYLESNSLKIAGVIGRKNYDTLFSHTEAYRALLENLQLALKKQDLGSSGQRNKLESDLRIHGGEMISLASNLVQEERQSVEDMLAWAKRVPVYFLIFLFLLMG